MKIIISLLLFSQAFSLVENGFLLTSDSGVQVTIFKEKSQDDNKRYLLIEGISGEWNNKPIEVTLENGNKIEYTIGKNKFVVLAGQKMGDYVSYSLAIQKPYKEYSGLYTPSYKVSLDYEKLDKMLNAK